MIKNGIKTTVLLVGSLANIGVTLYCPRKVIATKINIFGHKEKQFKIKIEIKRSHEKTHVIVNKISTPTNKVHPQNHSFSHLNNFKAQDKNRLEDLGTKLENLRNQIRK